MTTEEFMIKALKLDLQSAAENYANTYVNDERICQFEVRIDKRNAEVKLAENFCLNPDATGILQLLIEDFKRLLENFKEAKEKEGEISEETMLKCMIHIFACRKILRDIEVWKQLRLQEKEADQ